MSVRILNTPRTPTWTNPQSSPHLVTDRSKRYGTRLRPPLMRDGAYEYLHSRSRTRHNRRYARREATWTTRKRPHATWSGPRTKSNRRYGAVRRLCLKHASRTPRCSPRRRPPSPTRETRAGSPPTGLAEARHSRFGSEPPGSHRGAERYGRRSAGSERAHEPKEPRRDDGHHADGRRRQLTRQCVHPRLCLPDRLAQERAVVLGDVEIGVELGD
jgi:hypothetical protein